MIAIRVTQPLSRLRCSHGWLGRGRWSVRFLIVPLYAAYGSNLDPEQMRTRCPHSPFAGVGWIPGWRLTFGGEDLGWEGALATIVEQGPDEPASSVFVGLYDITDYDRIA